MPRIVDRAERRHRLADAAADVIAGAGIDATGLRDVAHRAALTTGAVTHYFDTRADLLVAAYEAVMTQLAARQETGLAMAAGEDPIARLASFLPIDATSIRDWRVWLAFSARALIDPRLAARHRHHYARIIADLRAELDAAGFAAGAASADAVVALIDGIAVRMLLEPGDWPAERIAAALAPAATLLTDQPETCR